MTEPNIPLLRKVVEWVEEQAQLPQSERTWYQARWLCGTNMCIAGKVVLDDGWTPQILGVGAIGEDQADSSVFVVKDGEGAYLPEVARKALGLTYDQGRALFNGNNTATRIRQTAEEIAGEPL